VDFLEHSKALQLGGGQSQSVVLDLNLIQELDGELDVLDAHADLTWGW
jgi:hypothetical protein